MLCCVVDVPLFDSDINIIFLQRQNRAQNGTAHNHAATHTQGPNYKKKNRKLRPSSLSILEMSLGEMFLGTTTYLVLPWQDIKMKQNSSTIVVMDHYTH